MKKPVRTNRSTVDVIAVDVVVTSGAVAPVIDPDGGRPRNVESIAVIVCGTGGIGATGGIPIVP